MSKDWLSDRIEAALLEAIANSDWQRADKITSALALAGVRCKVVPHKVDFILAEPTTIKMSLDDMSFSDWEWRK